MGLHCSSIASSSAAHKTPPTFMADGDRGWNLRVLGPFVRHLVQDSPCKIQVELAQMLVSGPVFGQ